MVTLTVEQEKFIDFVRLYQRSTKDADGWAQCSSPVAIHIVSRIPDDLIERDGLRVRLSERGKAIGAFFTPAALQPGEGNR